MKGKFVNVCMALLNLLIGALIVIYAFKVPSEITELTVQENEIIQVVKIFLYVLLGIVTILNFIHVILDSKNTARKVGYIISLFSLSFIFFPYMFIALFSIIGGFVILISSIRLRWVEANSYTAISIIIFLALYAILIIACSFIYESLGRYILERENKDELAYKDTYFKYIVELENDDPKYGDVFINIKKEDKYGYINSKGELMINFEFDYASPFVDITMYDKHFDIALVCIDGRSKIILKNRREVMTYKSESMDDDFEAKIEELEDFYYNTLEQTDEMKFEIDTSLALNNTTKVERYDTTDETYTYRYDLNEDYDLLVTVSSMGLGDTYELAEKNNLSMRIELDCDYLDYDENYLYIFSNGCIPFYEDLNGTTKRKQGWFTSYGKKVTLAGNAQIIDFFGDNTLIKNHNDDTIYFINEDGEIVSDLYKEIYVCSNDRFIVKNSDNKYIVINSDFEKVFTEEWDYADPSLLDYGLYVFGTIDGIVEFNDFYYADNLKIEIIDSDGNLIANNLQQIYNTTYKISNNKLETYSNRYSEFLEDIKSMNVTYVGDKYYE